MKKIMRHKSSISKEGPLEQLRHLQKQIDEYIQRLEAGETPAGS